MVVTLLVRRLLLTPEVHSLNPVIGKFYITHGKYYQLYRKDENIEQETWDGPLKKHSRKGEPLKALKARVRSHVRTSKRFIQLTNMWSSDVGWWRTAERIPEQTERRT